MSGRRRHHVVPCLAGRDITLYHVWQEEAEAEAELKKAEVTTPLVQVVHKCDRHCAKFMVVLWARRDGAAPSAGRLCEPTCGMPLRQAGCVSPV